MSAAQVGGGDGQAQTHAIAVSHEDEARTVGLVADRQNGETVSEERVRRIRHLDFVRRRRRRVVEGGINMSARSTLWIMDICELFSDSGCVTACCCA